MQITSAIVLDALRDLNPASLYSDDRRFSFSDFLLLTPGFAELDPNTLYLADTEQIERLPRVKDTGICILCRGKMDRAKQLAAEKEISLILLPENTEFSTAANVVYALFARVKDWDHAIQQAILQKKRYQEIAEIAGPLLGDNALIIANGSYDVLGSNLSSVPGNKKLNDIITKRYYPKQVTDTLAEMDYPIRSLQMQKPAVIYPPTYSGCPLFLVSYYSESMKLKAFIALHFLDTMPTDGQFDLFCHFAELMQQCFDQEESDSRSPGPVTYLLQGLIEHTMENEAYLIDRARSLGLSLEGMYRLGVIQWDEFSRDRAYYLLSRLRSILVRSYFRIFLYRESILLIVNWTSGSLRALEDITQVFSDVAEVIRVCNGHAGFSPVFESLIKLNVAYKQALSAVKYGKMIFPEDCVHFYAQSYIYEMLDHYSSEYPLRDMYCQRLNRLKDDAEDGDSVNLRLLRAYLRSNCSISAAAKFMHMHRNSIIYRLEKIQDLLGLNLENPDVQLRLRISFKTMDLLEGREFTCFPQPESYEDILHIE